MDALHLAERQGHDQTKKALSDAQEINKELLTKIEESEKNRDQLLENLERSVSCFTDSLAVWTLAG